MNFLTKEQFERQAFIYWMKTGIMHTYKDYLKFAELEIKSAKKPEEQESDDVETDPSDVPEKIILDPSKRYYQWIASNDACGACTELDGKIFVEETGPFEVHPNCKCTLALLDKNGNPTGNKKRPKPKKPCSYINSPKGPNRNHPVDKEDRPHYGTDFKVPPNNTIPSPVDGKITHNDHNAKGNGNRVAVTDKNGIEHHFYHMNALSHLPIGTSVSQGQEIGKSGNTGKSSGPHVHYETRDSNNKNGYPDNVINPAQKDLDYLDDYWIDKLGCPK